MSWGSELWDQYDQICVHTEHGVEFVKRVQQFVKDRIHAELIYAKELRKLVKSYRKKEEEESKYTAIQAFGKVVTETNDLAGQRELIAEYLQNDVLKPLQDLAKNTLSERKKLMVDGVELHKAVKDSMELLDRNKRNYMKASEEKEVSSHTLDKADNDPQSTKAKIDKLTQISRSKDQAAEEARNNYILQLEATNQYRRSHFYQRMPHLMDKFMQMNTDHINTYKSLIAAFAESHRRVQPVINTCLNNITESSVAIDPSKDNSQYVEERKTGYPVPSDVDFEEYQGKIKKKEKKEDKRKFEARDFSHLPPEQRKKKLIKKINELDALYNKSISDITAMEKMKDIYEKNPQLGDSKVVAQQLLDTRARIDTFSIEIQEFKGYLAQAEGHNGSSLTAPVQGSPRPPSVKEGKNGKSKKKDKGKGVTKLSPGDIEVVQNDAVSTTSSVTYSPRGSSDNVKVPLNRNDTWFSDDEGGSDSVDRDIPGGKRALMIYDFEAQQEDELSCQTDDEVVVVEDLGDGWLKIQKGQDQGYVPETYVQYL